MPAHPFDNTYIFYTADHGIAIGRHGLQGKQNLYEHTWRVPMIVKNPKATNLASDSQHAAKLADMRTLLLEEMRRLNDPWRFSNQPDDGLTPPKRNKPASNEKGGKKPKQRVTAAPPMVGTTYGWDRSPQRAV